ncbi:MAG: hypothetical protein MR357_08130 [Anaeroplasma sp.]|nr:hypothetical protein [Anaeroplasma sp.]
MIIKKQREEQLRLQEQLEKEFIERHKKRVKEATKYVESLTLEEMKQIIFNYKINELEEFKEQFYEDPYDEEYDW